MLIKSKHPKFSLVLLALLLSCSAIAQVQFPSTNTIYTVEDGREFVEFWRGKDFSKKDEIGSLSKIFTANNFRISFLNKRLSTFNKEGTLISSNYLGEVSSHCFDYEGNTLLYVFSWPPRKGIERYVLKYNANGNLIDKINVNVGALSEDVKVFPKHDGGFYLVEVGDVREWAYEYNENDLLFAYEFDRKGNLLEVIDFKSYFQKIGKSVQAMLVDKENNLFLYGVDKTVYKFTPEGNLIYSFTVEDIDKYIPLENFIFDHQGNLAFCAYNSRNIYIYSPEGKLQRQIELTFGTQKKFSVFGFGFESDGSIISHNVSTGIVSRHENSGIFKEILFCESDFAIPYFKLFGETEFYQGYAIATGPEGQLYSSSGNPGRICKFSPDGQLRKEIALKGDIEIDCLEINSRGHIFAQDNDYIQAYNKKGKHLLINPKGYHRNAYSSTSHHVMTPDDKLYFVENSRIFNLLPDFVLNQIFYWDYAKNRGITKAMDLAVDKSGYIHVLDENSVVKVYDPYGRFIKKVKLPNKWLRSLKFDPEGNYLADGYTFDASGNYLNCLHLPYSNDSTFIGNRLFVTQKFIGNGIVSLSTKRLITKSNNCYNISGEYSSTIPRHHNAHFTVFLQGKTEKGKTFYSITDTSGQKGKFSFTDIPGGSTYKIWATNPSPDYNEFGKVLFKGVVRRENIHLVFKDRRLPYNYIRIKGVVLNKFGHPIPGVRVSFGKKFTMTGIHGRYTLAVPPNSQGTLKARKDKYEFAKPAIKLKLNTMDRMPVNFFEKK